MWEGGLIGVQLGWHLVSEGHSIGFTSFPCSSNHLVTPPPPCRVEGGGVNLEETPVRIEMHNLHTHISSYYWNKCSIATSATVRILQPHVSRLHLQHKATSILQKSSKRRQQEKDTAAVSRTAVRVKKSMCCRSHSERVRLENRLSAAPSLANCSWWCCL